MKYSEEATQEVLNKIKSTSDIKNNQQLTKSIENILIQYAARIHYEEEVELIEDNHSVVLDVQTRKELVDELITDDNIEQILSETISNSI